MSSGRINAKLNAVASHEPSSSSFSSANVSSSNNASSSFSFYDSTPQFIINKWNYIYSLINTPSNSYIIHPKELKLDWASEIGKGSTAQILKSHLRGESVAIKKLLHTEDLTSYENETAILQKLMELKAPHMVPYYGKTDTRPYSIVIKYVPQNLAQYARSSGFNWGYGYQIVKDMTEFFAFSHQHNILHRDIKLDNILTDTQHAYVSDFGVSLDQENPYRLDDLVGTLAYIAPEILLNRQHPVYTVYSDSYSIGLALCEMANGGKTLFAHDNDNKIEEKIIKGKHEKIPENCPSILRSIIRNCWDPIPEKRPKPAEIFHILDADADVNAAINKVRLR